MDNPTKTAQEQTEKQQRIEQICLLGRVTNLQPAPQLAVELNSEQLRLLINEGLVDPQSQSHSQPTFAEYLTLADELKAEMVKGETLCFKGQLHRGLGAVNSDTRLALDQVELKHDDGVTIKNRLTILALVSDFITEHSAAAFECNDERFCAWWD